MDEKKKVAATTGTGKSESVDAGASPRPTKRRRVFTSHDNTDAAKNRSDVNNQVSGGFDDNSDEEVVEIVKVQMPNDANPPRRQTSRAFAAAKSASSDDEVEIVGVSKPSSPTDSNKQDRKMAARPSGSYKGDDYSLLYGFDDVWGSQGQAAPAVAAMQQDDDVIDLTETKKQWKTMTQNAAYARTLAVGSLRGTAKKEAENRDAEAARALAARFKQEEEEAVKAERKNQAAMLETATGKSFAFVEGVLAVHERLAADLKGKAAPDFIKPVAKDDIVALTEKLLVKQEEFKAAGKAFGIDLGYHYTKEEYLQSISTGGLLTKQERTSLGITATHNGSALGDGVYTANGPFDTWNQRYGNVGLIVARLHGKVGLFAASNQKLAPDADTIVNGTSAALRTSAQCVALMQYDGKELKYQGANCPSKTVLDPFVEALQELVDRLFNTGGASIPPEIANAKEGLVVPRNANQLRQALGVPAPVFQFAPGVPAPAGFRVVPPLPPAAAARRTARKSSRRASSSLTRAIHYQMPVKTTSQDVLSMPVQSYAKMIRSQSTCPICLLPAQGQQMARLNTCGHELHCDCLRQCLEQASSRCPTCREPISGTPTGKMPSGTMKISQLKSNACSGYSAPSLQITYSFPSGTQEAYHPNPGQVYGGETRVAYLPDNEEGRRLLGRLKDSFLHGLTFAIGTSLGTGAQNVITWQSIPHKTSLTGGVQIHGFPDDKYFFNCNKALDDLHVKPAAS